MSRTVALSLTIASYVALGGLVAKSAAQSSQISPRPFHHADVSALAFSSDGNLLASAGDGEIRVWDLDSGDLVSRFDGHVYSSLYANGPIDGTTELAFIQDDSLLVSSGRDGNIRITSIESAQTERTIAEPWVIREITAQTRSPIEPLFYRRAPIDGFAISHDESRIAATVFGTIQIWRLSDGLLLESFGMDRLRQDAMSLDAFTPKDWEGELETFRTSFLATHLHFPDSMIVGIDSLSRWRSRLPVFGHFRSIVFSNDDTMIAAGCTSHSNVWTSPGLDLLHTIPEASWVAFQPDSATVVTGSRGAPIRIRCVETGEVIRVVDIAAARITISQDATAALGTIGGRLRLWNIESWEAEIVPIEVDIGTVKTFAISADGRFVAAVWRGYDENRIHIWDRLD